MCCRHRERAEENAADTLIKARERDFSVITVRIGKRCPWRWINTGGIKQ